MASLSFSAACRKRFLGTLDNGSPCYTLESRRQAADDNKLAACATQRQNACERNSLLYGPGNHTIVHNRNDEI